MARQKQHRAVTDDVLIAFDEARSAGLPTAACYRAGVEAWRRRHPDHAAPYASKKAVEIILRAKQADLLTVR